MHYVRRMAANTKANQVTKRKPALGGLFTASVYGFRKLLAGSWRICRLEPVLFWTFQQPVNHTGFTCVLDQIKHVTTNWTEFHRLCLILCAKRG